MSTGNLNSSGPGLSCFNGLIITEVLTASNRLSESYVMGRAKVPE